MRDVNIQPQSWVLDDEDADIAEKSGEAKPTPPALSFSYARV